jgi:hypothetical protein
MNTLYPLVWIALIVCLFLAWYFWHRANHRDRMMMLEKGLDVEDSSKKKTDSVPLWLKISIVVIGLSCGLLLLTLLAAYNLVRGEAMPLAILGLCGGVSMIIAHRLKGNKRS